MLSATILDSSTTSDEGGAVPTVPTASIILAQVRAAHPTLTGWALADYMSDLVAESLHAHAQAIREAKASKAVAA